MDKKYVVRWTQGNGYHCGCCRSTYESSEEFDDFEGAVALAQSMLRARVKDRWSHEGDNEDIFIQEVTREWSEQEIKEID